MARPPQKLTELHRAAIRLLVIGVKTSDAAEIHGMTRYDLSRAYHSEAGQAYAAHMRGICEHYTASLHVLGLVPSDITRPGCRYRTPNPPSNPAGLRRAAREGIARSLGKGLAQPEGREETREGGTTAGGDGDDGHEGEGEG